MNSTTTSYGYSYEHGHSRYADSLPSVDVVSANVISTIGFGISILLLCTHLIVYSITEDMWTLTGNSLASFCFSLLLSYCAYIGGMVVHDASTPCAIVALSAFYFFLTNSSWLLSISLQLYYSTGDDGGDGDVAKSQRHRHSAASRTCAFVRYSVFSWTEPALILGAALFVETYNVDVLFETPMPKNIRIDVFPLETNCFNRNAAMLIWFLVLFNVNLIATFVVSAFTAFVANRNGHQQQQQQPQLVATDTTRDHHFFTVVLKYYMRLSLLVGFVWIVGMCMVYFKGHVLQIVFAISNAALALYIFLVFTFNNKLSSVVFNNDKSYGMETFRRHSVENRQNPAIASDV